jgi:hypothetical protein
METFRKYFINTFAVLWRLFWNMLAFLLRAFTFCCKIVAYTFLAFTALILLRRRR